MPKRKNKPTHVLNAVGRRRVDPHVTRRLKRTLARDGFGALYMIDRKLSLALKRTHDEFMAELGSEAGASASALCWSLAEVKMRRDTFAALVLELGPGIINKRKRTAYPLVAQLNEMERLFADLLRQFCELKVQTDLERRLEALERGVTIDGDAANTT